MEVMGLEGGREVEKMKGKVTREGRGGEGGWGVNEISLLYSTIYAT
jgi:hypothetical protein